MKLPRAFRIASLASLLSVQSFAADDDYQPGPDSLPQPGVPKGEMLKDKYIAAENSVFPGTEREYQIYLPAGLDTSKPAPFMVFQDGVIYQAPTVFDNLIAKKEIPPLIGIFIKPGVVPAANDNALPRFNRSYEYDSVTNSYSRFLIDEFLPAIKARHKLNLSDDPNARGIAGSSSGGICAFMVAWHRPDSFRRVFTSVGTYVGIHGADQLPVLVRKFEPKPIRIHLQSGENDNNLYCGDWWMANQMMERSLTWNGYDVNHTWGTGGHNQKHATAIFPDVLRWLWKGYPDEPVKANPRGDAKWRGYEVVENGDWGELKIDVTSSPHGRRRPKDNEISSTINWSTDGTLVLAHSLDVARLDIISPSGGKRQILLPGWLVSHPQFGPDGNIYVFSRSEGRQDELLAINLVSELVEKRPLELLPIEGGLCITNSGTCLRTADLGGVWSVDWFKDVHKLTERGHAPQHYAGWPNRNPFNSIVLTADQTQAFATTYNGRMIWAWQLREDNQNEMTLGLGQPFGELIADAHDKTKATSLCVDTNGWLYVATSLGIQVLDQAGRVNFIIPTPKQPHDVCFGGKDLSELFIACGDTIYKRKTKAHGYISGQMAPIKPPPPKL